MSTFTLLSQAEEDDLHAKRLLNIEEKPYKRVQKRLLAPTNPIQTFLRQQPTSLTTTRSSDENATSDADIDGSIAQEDAPNGGDVHPEQSQEDTEIYSKQLRTFTHQTLHDFSALRTSLARLQFLLNSNAAERDRYSSQTTTITSQHAQITSETTELRSRLEEARSRLEQRKAYDELARKVLYVNGRDGARSKTREELRRESERLRNEIEELEREGEELKGHWKDRREALARVNLETERLRRVVRGEPEVVEREDGEDGDEVRTEDGEGEEQGEKRREEDEQTQLQQRDGDDHHDDHHEDDMLGTAERDRDVGGSMSNAGTPRPMDDAPTPTAGPVTGENGGMTPLPTGAMTPLSVADHEEEEASPRYGNVANGSGLKQEVHYAGESEDEGDVSMADQQIETKLDVPEVIVHEEASEKAGEMDVS